MKWRSALIRGRARSAALIAAGAFAVHQSRLLLAHGGLDGHNLLERGNALLLHSVPLLAGLLLAFATATLIRAPDGPERSSSTGARVLTYSVGILAVLGLQEMLEAALLAGHAADLAALFSAGGWAALPVAVIFGFIAAAVDRGIETVAVLASRRDRFDARPDFDDPSPTAPHLAFGARDPFAFGFARPPPPSLA